MAIVINGSGTVTGLAVGGLPDDTVDAGTLANSINTEITANTAKTGITSSQATAITAALPKAGGTVTGHLNVSSGGIKVGSDALKTFGGYNFIQYGDRGMIGGYANDSLGIFYNTYHSSGSKAIETGTACNVQLLNGGIRFQTAASVSADAAQSLTDRLEITTDGRGLSQFTAKAWVNFNGTNMSTRDSHNVSSLTDNATGNYSVNFTVHLANSDFCSLGNSTKSGGSASASNSSATYIGEGRSTNYVSVETYRADGSTARDSTFINVAVFGD